MISVSILVIRPFREGTMGGSIGRRTLHGLQADRTEAGLRRAQTN